MEAKNIEKNGSHRLWMILRRFSGNKSTFCLSVSAFKYEIRCYTNREALNQATFTNTGILVHDSFTPQPEDYGTTQTCTVGVPWPNENFYYGLVSIGGYKEKKKKAC